MGKIRRLVGNPGKLSNLNNVHLAMPAGVAPTVVDGAAHQFNIQLLDNAPSNQLQWTFRGGTAQGIAPAEAFNNRQAAFQNDTLSGLIELDVQVRTATLNNRASTAINTQVMTEQRLLTDKPGRQFLSQDGQHVLVSNRIKSNQQVSHQWQLYDRAGQLLMERVSPHSYTPFLVADGQLLIIEPANGQIINGELVRMAPNMKAIDVSTGQTSWSTAVRPITYFGPLPI